MMQRTMFVAAAVVLAAVSPAFSATVFDDAVAYWPFEGSGTTVTDESLTAPIDLQFSSSGLTWVEGAVGQAICSPASTDWLTTNGDVDALDLGRDDPFSWAAWVNKQSSVMVLSSKMLSSGTYRGWWIYGRDDGAVDFLLRSENTADKRIWMRSAPGAIQDFNWSHLTVTFSYDETDLTKGVRMYSRGSEVPLTVVSDGASFTTPLPTDNTVSFNVFARNEAGSGNGCIDELAIWKRVLDQSEIDQLVAAGPGPPERPEGNYVVNGDFEDTEGWGIVGSTDFPRGWGYTARKNAATPMTDVGAIGGSGTSAYCEAFWATSDSVRRELRQNLVMETLSEWQFDVDFACANPFATADDRSFNVSLLHSGGILSLRVVDSDSNGVGDIQYYDAAGAGWTSIAEMSNSVVFDDNLFFEPATHNLTVVGHYTTEEPTFDVLLKNSEGTEFTATGLSGFLTGPPSAGRGVNAIQFPTFNSLGGFTIDNVSLIDLIDEPPVLAGDLNGDGMVGSADLDIVRGNWGGTVTPGDLPSGDPSGDGTVGSADLDIIRANWGATAAAAVPEPGFAAILLCAGVLIGFTRRR